MRCKSNTRANLIGQTQTEANNPTFHLYPYKKAKILAKKKKKLRRLLSKQMNRYELAHARSDDCKNAHIHRTYRSTALASRV